MRLRPRHYILIVLILAVGAFNLYRRSHPRQPTAVPQPAVADLAPATPADAQAWAAFDKAAALRDAPDADFLPALTALNTLPGNSDISGCKTWLQFYRQGRLHPAVDPAWSIRSTAHLNGCTRLHRDTSV